MQNLELDNSDYYISDSNSLHMPKTFMDLTNTRYNEADGNIYEKIETELPFENINGYEQLLADIPLNDIESVIIGKEKDDDDGFKRELAVSDHKKVILS